MFEGETSCIYLVLAYLYRYPENKYTKYEISNYVFPPISYVRFSRLKVKTPANLTVSRWQLNLI